MEHNMKTFDELWEQEERQGLQQRLQSDYPAWQRRRRQRITLACTFAVVVVAGITFNLHLSTPKNYDGVACNRSGIADTHWADVAANILISNCEI